MSDRVDAPLIGYGKDGPMFERLCPKCARFVKFPKTMRWKEDFHGLCEFEKVECSRCGPVEPAHIGWVGDFC